MVKTIIANEFSLPNPRFLS